MLRKNQGNTSWKRKTLKFYLHEQRDQGYFLNLGDKYCTLLDKHTSSAVELNI